MYNDRLALKNGYELRLMQREEFNLLYHQYCEQLFDDVTQVFRLEENLSDDEKEKLKKLNINMGQPFILRIGVFKEEEFVGWHMGYQESATTFYMQNSGVLPQHRCKGLYTELSKYVVKIVTEKGFQKIYSYHTATNNAVIIAKLKQGFIISALEINDAFGVRLCLSYYNNPLQRKIMDYRVGFIKPDEEVKRYLKL
jgi:ribosomal protein S18 acetylase RimI-like enzyme